MHHNHGDWAVPPRPACTAFSTWNYFESHRIICQFYKLSSIHPRGHKGNATTDLRPKGVSTRRHNDVTHALYKKGCKLEKLAPPICTRGTKEKPKNSEKNTFHTLPVTGTDEPCAHGWQTTCHCCPQQRTGENMLFDPTERNVHPFLFPTRIRTMKKLVLHRPSVTRMSPWPGQHKWPSSSGQD